MLRGSKIELELHINSDKIILLCENAEGVLKCKLVDLIWHVWKVELQESVN